MEDCIFCKLIKGELPSKKLYEDDEIIAFNDINPKAPVHIIIAPKKHIKTITEAGKEEQMLLGHIQLTAAKIAGEMNIDGAFKLTTNNGEGAGQTVPHLHYHLIGGWTNKNEAISELGI